MSSARISDKQPPLEIDVWRHNNTMSFVKTAFPSHMSCGMTEKKKRILGLLLFTTGRDSQESFT